jgi:hypothetical protein
MVGCVLFLDSNSHVLMTDNVPYIKDLDDTNTVSIIYYNSQQPHAQQLDIPLANIPSMQPDKCDIRFKIVSLSETQKAALVQEPSYREQSPADRTTRFGFVAPTEWKTADPDSCMAHVRKHITSRVPPGTKISPAMKLIQAIFSGYRNYKNPIQVHEPAPKRLDTIILSFDPVQSTLSFNPYISNVTYHDANPTSKILQRHAARAQLIFKTFVSDITPAILQKVLTSMMASWKTLFPEELPLAIMRKNVNFVETMTKLTILALFAIHRLGVEQYRQHTKLNRLFISLGTFWRAMNMRPDLTLQLNNVLQITFWS